MLLSSALSHAHQKASVLSGEGSSHTVCYPSEAGGGSEVVGLMTGRNGIREGKVRQVGCAGS